MSGALLARLEAVGATLRRAPDGSLRLRPSRPIPPDLLAEARAQRDDLALMVAEREAENAEREAIRIEPELPSTGSPERERQEQQQRAMVAGLLRASVWCQPPAALRTRPPISIPTSPMNLQEPRRERRR
ncbi:hypothetical protein QMO56_24985 [Roseomonas sp. E05]|uniref:hypothetical protein n=1 Tax=Roseomonas sp. E05 TaxID=3046310 RepID=UPI0024BA9687|nr:hypothetical protein [Roseomonas sp. E05]MDJ0391367.1 hypothetical protein [Roseomonas sp. E05]